MGEEIKKKEAAARFDVSERALERAVGAGLLHPKTEKKPRGGFVSYFDTDELEQWKASKGVVVERTHEEVDPATSPVAASVAVALAQRENLTTALARRDQLQAETLLKGFEMIHSSLDTLVDRLTTQGATPPLQATPTPQARLTWTVREAAKVAGVPERLLRDAIKARTLKAVRIGRGLRVRPSDVERWIDDMYQ